MQRIHSTKFLRGVLLADAATCAAMGLSLVLFAGKLSELLGLPASLLFYAGLSLFPVAGLLLYAGAREQTETLVVRALVAGNALWVLASLGLLISGWVAPNALGIAFVVFQAAGVAILASLESFGLKQSAALPA
jgi:hypothetical protein